MTRGTYSWLIFLTGKVPSIANESNFTKQLFNTTDHKKYQQIKYTVWGISMNIIVFANILFLCEKSIILNTNTIFWGLFTCLITFVCNTKFINGYQKMKFLMISMI